MKFYKRQTKEEDTLMNKNVHPGLCSTTRLKLKHVLGLLNISQKIKLQVCNMDVEFIKKTFHYHCYTVQVRINLSNRSAITTQ